MIGAGGACLFLPNLSLAEEMLVIDPLVQWIKVVLLLLGAMVALLSGGARFSDHPAEYHAILLLAISGMTLMVSTENLIMIFVAVELTSLSRYARVGFDKRSAVGAEAALKYFLYGGASAAMILFGFGYLYGVTGVTDLAVCRRSSQARSGPLFWRSALSYHFGFALRLPQRFHMWALMFIGEHQRRSPLWSPRAQRWRLFRLSEVSGRCHGGCGWSSLVGRGVCGGRSSWLF